MSEIRVTDEMVEAFREVLGGAFSDREIDAHDILETRRGLEAVLQTGGFTEEYGLQVVGAKRPHTMSADRAKLECMRVTDEIIVARSVGPWREVVSDTGRAAPGSAIEERPLRVVSDGE